MRIAIWIGVLGWLVSAPLWAAEQLTADRCVEMALVYSPELAALAHQIDEDRAGVDAAVRFDNPELRISDFRSSQQVMPLIDGNRPVTFEDIELGMRWRPPNLGSWEARKATAERRVDQTAAGLKQEQRNLSAQVRTLHAQVLNYDQQLQIANTAVELRAKLRDLIARRIESQAGTALEQNLAELDYLEAVGDREELEKQRRETMHQLLMTLGLPPHADVQLVAEGTTMCQLPARDLDNLIAGARQSSPELAVRRARSQEVQADISRAYLEIIPWFDFVQVSYALGRLDNPFEFRGDYSAASLRLALSIDVPLFDWNQAEIAGLEARKARYEVEYTGADQRVENRVRAAYRELVDQVELFESYRAADQRLVDQSLEQINRALELGEADQLQMRMVQNRTLRARRVMLRTALNCQEVAIELGRLVGELPLRYAEEAAPPASQPATRDGSGAQE